MRRWLLMVGIIGMMATATATPVAAACDTRFFTFPAWYNGLTKDNCEMKDVSQDNNGLRNFIVRIVLNITEIILQVVAYASLIFVMVGGFKYMIAAGSPDQMAAAKTTILNALVGLVISIFSVAIVNAVGGLF